MADGTSSIDRAIAQGKYYDAQQMVKRLFARHCARHKAPEALQLAANFAERFASCGQTELCAELAVDMARCFHRENLPPSDGNVQSLLKLFELCRAAADGRTEKYRILEAGLLWLRQRSDAPPEAVAAFHSAAGASHRADGHYGDAQGHLVLSRNHRALNSLLREWMKVVYENEVDLLVLRTILMLLSIGDAHTAHALLEELPFSFDEPDVAVGVQAAYMLAAAATAVNHDLFRLVRSKYSLVFRRDAVFDTLLDATEEKVFGRKLGGAGILDMLSNMFTADAPA